MNAPHVPDIGDVEAAAERLRGIAVETPLLRSPELDERVGGTVLLKAENLQRTGSFKIRGAYNLMSQLTPEQASHGVVAWSSGNHAQGVAAAGTLLGIRTTIVMPEDAPRAKIENTRRLGGEPVLYDRYTGDREAIARKIAAERGAELVPSYEHSDIIAGQGTVGLEIMDQALDYGLVPDQVLICCGGGGLGSGCAIAIKARSAETRVYLVEPEDFDDTRRSFEQGRRVRNEGKARSICDALQTDMPGQMTFDINRRLASGVLTVSDDEVREAIRFAFRYLKLVVEPGGAVALAAVLAGKVDTNGKVTAVVLSGGNIDTALFAAIQSEDGEERLSPS
ncbi:MAG: threonine/serine dehydratase [Gammaproteobacteria bacterium]|nr:threonine/serine dehydratase [Gammaproteobacteria bacterium]MDH4255080.1 threonine/serine dehydratase [Gammaproteobacteria bacterium]MDH5308764.1 threonine/serine dehydratase [Gammaproteobacteria bacterium]